MLCSMRISPCLAENVFFRLAWRTANCSVMNSALLFTIGEGADGGQVVVGRSPESLQQRAAIYSFVFSADLGK